MSMKKKRKLLDLSVALVFIPLALALRSGTQSAYYIWAAVAIVLAFAWVIVMHKVWRCPHCDMYLGRDAKITYCPHCGKELDENGGT